MVPGQPALMPTAPSYRLGDRLLAFVLFAAEAGALCLGSLLYGLSRLAQGADRAPDTGWTPTVAFGAAALVVAIVAYACGRRRRPVTAGVQWLVAGLCGLAAVAVA